MRTSSVMRHASWVKIISFVLIIIFVGGVFTACQSQDKDIAYWTCPMHPQIKAEDPGQCPICGMDLVPVKKDPTSSPSTHNPSPITSSQFTQLIGLTTDTAAVRPLTKTIMGYGKVAHDRELWVAQNELVEALKLRDAKLIQTVEQKLSFMGLSPEWIETIKKTRRVDQSLHLNVNSGSHYFEANVSQDDVGLVAMGAAVEVIDMQGRLITMASVKAIGSLIDMNSRSVRLLIEADQIVTLKPNTFAQFKIKVNLGERLSLPHHSVLFNGDSTLVYVAHADGHYQARQITLGAAADGFEEIISGIKEGEKVITNGHFLIDSETQIKVGASQGHKH